MITYILAFTLWASVWQTVIKTCHAWVTATSLPDSPILNVTVYGTAEQRACADAVIMGAR